MVYNVKTGVGTHLYILRTHACFDIMSKYPDNIVGQRFGKLVVLSMYERTPQRKYKWLCQCDCGNQCVVFGSKLKNGHTKSCGCLRHNSPPNKTHGKKDDVLYPVWCQMRYRCSNPKHHAYKWYGGKGITICDEWNDFQTFYDWMHNNGWKPGLTIDRIDPNGDYCPENCRLVDLYQQQNNRSNNIMLEYNGQKDTISNWAKKIGISRWVIAARYYRGITGDELFSKNNLQNGKELRYKHD